MKDKNEIWNLDDRPSTKTKLEILAKVFEVWLTIWNKQDWPADEWYVIDLFAGRGKYNDGSSGSPLIFLEVILSKLTKLRKNLRIKLFFVEKDKTNFEILKSNISEFLDRHPEVNDRIDIKFYQEDCNDAIDKIITEINDSNKYPLFVLIDPTGLQSKKETIEKIVQLQNRKDIMFNYILEGVRRTSGIVKKEHLGEELSEREEKTVKTLKEFIGEDIDVVKKSDLEILNNYCSIFTSRGLPVVGYDAKYPDRNDILYYLLFATKNEKVSNIVREIYAKMKEKNFGKTLFGGMEFYIDTILDIEPSILTVRKKSLLYKTKVEYGDWTINHIVGCKHGCQFPCYAMMLAKRFGWIKNYEDWINPRLVENALELLDKEIPLYKDQIDFVHLCFMSDPFMYDYEKKQLIPEVKDLTLKIIEKLNMEGIRVTTLTKGFYPREILENKKLLPTNEYGITLVSLNDNFKRQFEPFSAPYEKRIESLKSLADNGLQTWVSMEPYPTPELDDQAENVEKILENISFAKKIIFGRLNYRKLTDYSEDNKWKDSNDFYRAVAEKVIKFCKENNIKLHIKEGTPMSSSTTINIFKR